MTFEGSLGAGADNPAYWPPLGTPEHARRCIARAADSLDFNGEPFGPPLYPRGPTHPGGVRTSPVTVAMQAALRASITAYVRKLRGDGMPPERVLVRVKHTVYEAAPRPLVASALMRDIVQWCIDAYYAP